MRRPVCMSEEGHGSGYLLFCTIVYKFVRSIDTVEESWHDRPGVQSCVDVVSILLVPTSRPGSGMAILNPMENKQ